MPELFYSSVILPWSVERNIRDTIRDLAEHSEEFLQFARARENIQCSERERIFTLRFLGLDENLGKYRA